MTMADSRVQCVTAPIDIRPTGRTSRRRRTLSSSLCSSSFEDQYTLDQSGILGEGAYGMVYKCTHRITDLQYAVKIVDKRLGARRQKVFREVEVYHQCQQSPNVLHMVEFFETDNKFYLVFELIRGGSLEARIEDIGRQIHEAQVKSLVHSIAAALDFLHGRGIAHRDIKPANILLPDPLSLDGAKLCDFDLASRAKTANEVRGDICMTSPVGSAEFMAPEVVRAFCAMDDERVKYDQKCDMWSLGVITYSLLAGRPPFEGQCDSKCGWDEGEPCDECQDSLFAAIQQGQLEFPEAIFRQCSPEVINLISRCLSKDAALRPTPQEVLSHPWFKEDDLRRLKQIKPNVPTAALQNEVITRA